MNVCQEIIRCCAPLEAAQLVKVICAAQDDVFEKLSLAYWTPGFAHKATRSERFVVQARVITLDWNFKSLNDEQQDLGW